MSLDSAARAAGLTKPGLMYHFRTKEALVAAMVDHVIDVLEDDLASLAAASRADATPKERLRAYLTWATSRPHDAADLVMLSDPRLRLQMSARWADRFGPWVEVPDDLPAPERARLHAVRLIADGCWFSSASGVLPLSETDGRAVLQAGLELLEGTVE
ncbi:TetR/AcrR family transcriptional regulator [Aeromicrobium sp. CF4.19]|uniref:TetR/AcrR family transcriptional regulator n=1 Tax=Aeromicrobium sp. CF4.19 TaxID=3373082 RepID=UPI003EE4E080